MLQLPQDLTGTLNGMDLLNMGVKDIIDEFNRLQDGLSGGNIRQNRQNIVVFDDTTNRVLIGYNTQLQLWGLFVSKPGIDVLTATADQLIFNSNQDTFKIVKIVPISLTYAHTSPASEYHQTSVAHGLSYVPAFLAFNTIDPGLITWWGLSPAVASRPNPSLLPGSAGGFAVFVCFAEVTVDATKVYLSVQTGGFEPTATYVFSATAYLLQETFTG